MFEYRFDILDKDFYIKEEYINYDNDRFEYHKFVKGDIFGKNIWFEEVQLEGFDDSLDTEGRLDLVGKGIAIEQEMFRFRYNFSRKLNILSSGKINTLIIVESEEGPFEIYAKLTWKERFMLNARTKETIFYKDPIKLWSYIVGISSVLTTVLFTLYQYYRVKY